MPAGSEKRVAARVSGGFTLIELLVVIAIIVILASLIIAALPGVKKRAYDSSTMQLLSGLSTNCEQYYAMFDAYPGPLPPTMTANMSASPKMSGNQALFLSLSYSIYAPPIYTQGNPPVKVGNGPVVPAGSYINIDTGSVNPSDMSGPIDLSSSPPRTPGPFFNPSAKEFATLVQGASNGPGKIFVTPGAGTVNTMLIFPVLLDRYSDPMPLLYYRKTPNVQGTAAIDADSSGAPIFNTVSQSTAPLLTGTMPSNGVASYYINDNIEFTSSTHLNSITGNDPNNSDPAQSKGQQSNVLFAGCGINARTLCYYVSNAATKYNASSTGNPINSRGGFVIISAGYDHMYGKFSSSLPGGTGKNDDVFVVGGN